MTSSKASRFTSPLIALTISSSLYGKATLAFETPGAIADAISGGDCAGRETLEAATDSGGICGGKFLAGIVLMG